MKARPTSIRIFLTDGTPDGIRVISKANWVGQAVVSGRTQLAAALSRDEFSRPGVYLLLGPGNSGAERLYVGEADVVRDRLRQHAVGKDFWTRLVAFTSSDESLNKASVRYLEACLIDLARTANQWELANSSAPARPPLSEADRADAEWFLQEMLVIFPLLGVDAFEVAADKTAAEDTIELHLKQRGADARGHETAAGFVVLAGSRARAHETASIHPHISDARQRLVDRGVLVPNGDHLLLKQDFLFSSPSTAAGVLVGGTANGRIAWLDGQGRTLKTLQDTRTATAN